MRTCLSNIPLLPLSSTVLELHQSVGVLHATQHMVLVLPNRAPQRDIVKATLENPGNVLALSQWLDGLAHRRERQVHFGRSDFQSRVPRDFRVDERGCRAAQA